MILRCYSINKKIKSTYRPTLADSHIDYSCVLKQATEYMNPIFIIDTNGVWPGANYAVLYLDSTTIIGYYFISNIVSVNSMIFEFHCEMDCAALTKPDILAATAFVKYSSTEYSPLLIDDRVAMLTDVDISVTEEASIFKTTPSYILSVVGEDGVNCLILNDPNIIPGTLYTKAATDLVAALCIQWSDAQSCMLDLREVPLSLSSDYSLSPAHVGKIDVGSRGAINQYFNGALIEDNESIAIPTTYNDFRLFRFVTAHLYLPFVGVVELPLESFYPDPESSGLVKIKTVANPLTGSVIYTLKNGLDEMVATYSGSFGRSLPINASSPRDIVGSISHIVSGASSAAIGNSGGVVSNAVASMTDFVKFRGSVIGSFNGSYGEYAGTNFILAIEKHESNIEPSNLTSFCGRPCGKVMSLATLTGYVETVGFQLSGNYKKAVKDKVNEMLDSGIYIE